MLQVLLDLSCQCLQEAVPKRSTRGDQISETPTATFPHLSPPTASTTIGWITINVKPSLIGWHPAQPSCLLNALTSHFAFSTLMLQITSTILNKLHESLLKLILRTQMGFLIIPNTWINLWPITEDVTYMQMYVIVIQRQQHWNRWGRPAAILTTPKLRYFISP